MPIALDFKPQVRKSYVIYKKMLQPRKSYLVQDFYIPMIQPTYSG